MIGWLVDAARRRNLTSYARITPSDTSTKCRRCFGAKIRSRARAAGSPISQKQTAKVLIMEQAISYRILDYWN